ncbi:MAG: hypothetical protein ISP24_05110 [Rickettsiales bacterium]|nr:hypothetical protein [Rickettsiales bacterium]
MRPSYPDQNIEQKILSYFQNIPEYQSADEWMQRNVRSYTEHALKMLKDVFSSFSFTNGDHNFKTDIMENYYSDLCNNFQRYRDAAKEYKLAKTYPLTQDQHIEAIAALTENKDLQSFLSAKIESQTPPAAPTVQTTQAVSPTRSSSSAPQDTASVAELIAKIQDIKERAEILIEKLDSLNVSMSNSSSVHLKHLTKTKFSSQEIKPPRGLGG